MPPERGIVITCEHGGHRVPSAHTALFAGRGALLRSHRGWDPGALLVSRSLARGLGVALVAATTTRLLVDLNRSPHNPRVFSEITRKLPREARELLIARHHQPHWNRVRAALDAAPHPTLHLAVHSFTPSWRGRMRSFTVGILFDPKRHGERKLARRWQRTLASKLTASQVRRNAPYRGDADGLTTALRRERPSGRYLGLELELNQDAIATRSRRRALSTLLLRTLREAMRSRR